jgi:HSP20 family molecular chaperone IbpA
MAINNIERWMWADACELLERAERLHRQFFTPLPGEGDRIGWSPPTDVYETNREFVVVAALPGVEPADVEIILEGRVLTIRGERRLPAIAKTSTIHRMEIPHGRFAARFGLPGLGVSLAERGFDKGCLLLRLQKQFRAEVQR